MQIGKVELDESISSFRSVPGTGLGSGDSEAN